MQDKDVLSIEKQYELMYQDMVFTITDRKKTSYDLTKWIVTLHGLIIGFMGLKGSEVGMMFVLVPLLVGIVGLALNWSIEKELNSHRTILAKLREKVGGDFYTFHKEMVDLFLNKTNSFGYWHFIKLSHSFIILISSAVSCYVVYVFS